MKDYTSVEKENILLAIEYKDVSLLNRLANEDFNNQFVVDAVRLNYDIDMIVAVAKLTQVDESYKYSFIRKAFEFNKFDLIKLVVEGGFDLNGDLFNAMLWAAKRGLLDVLMFINEFAFSILEYDIILKIAFSSSFTDIAKYMISGQNYSIKDLKEGLEYALDKKQPYAVGIITDLIDIRLNNLK